LYGVGVDLLQVSRMARLVAENPGIVDEVFTPAERWTDVEVVVEPTGRPYVSLHGEVAAWAERQRLAALEVSLSHTGGLAIAQALVVWDRHAPSPALADRAAALEQSER
jgi:holo-[acyl-carrier protein] synthase